MKKMNYVMMCAVAMIAVCSCGANKNVASNSGKGKVTPVSVIFDSDLAPDYDDVGALTILHAMADNGEAKILATMSSNKNKLTSVCIDVINHYYGRPNLPIGAPLIGKNEKEGHREKWTEALPAHFPHRLTEASDIPDAVQVYRSVLAKQPDNSVVVVTVGFFSNLTALLQSPPDKYSPLDGKQLIAKKVKHLVSMAGTFPKGREYNVLVDAKASAMVAEQWPTRIIFSGWEIGSKIHTGKRLINSNIKNTPAKETFTISLRQENPDGRMSWDQTAVLIAVRGTDRYFNTVKGKIQIDEKGGNTWLDDPNGLHEYVTWKMPPEELTVVIEDLMMHEAVK
jgi:inosine-uridine nucleoside N-ribohydrolase